MFKKLQDWLFKEDYEELDIEEKENYMDEVIYEEKQHKYESKIKETPVHEENTYVKVAPTPKMNIDIKVDDPVKDEKKVKKNVEPLVKPRLPLTRKDDYEMPPVISPYFGVKGEEGNDTKDHTPELNTFNSNVTKKETFNSVISPFYGQKKSQKPIQQTIGKRVDSAHISHPLASEQKNENEIDESDFDEDNISLDEIVSSNEVNADDLIQFSLFGEDKKIEKDEFDNENTEENDNQELPF